MLHFTFVISSIFSIVLIIQLTDVAINKAIEAFKNARENF